METNEELPPAVPQSLETSTQQTQPTNTSDNFPPVTTNAVPPIPMTEANPITQPIATNSTSLPNAPMQMDISPAPSNNPMQTTPSIPNDPKDEVMPQMVDKTADMQSQMETDTAAVNPVTPAIDFVAPMDVRSVSPLSPLSVDDSSKHSSDSKDLMNDPLLAKSLAEVMPKSVSPCSISSGSRSRKSSQSSKSPKALSPGTASSPGIVSKSKKSRRPPPKKDDVLHDGRNDFYCWACHREGEVLCCELCPRVFHAKCLHMGKEPEGDWYCPECQKVMEAECKETQSRAMSQLSIDQLALHLRYALQRMKTTGCEPFLDPVDTKKFNDYLDYVFHPMDIKTLEKNVKKRKYGCTEAFLADVKWIVHNCVIYNGLQTKLTQIAKTIVKICQHEMSEIEVCPECYLNSCRKRENWFCEPCKEPHLLVWAKLQGFPHWPAKALRIDKGLVDARFFGQHDRAWIPLSGCYLMSKEMPFPVKNKKKGRGPGAKGGLDNAMQEAQHYIDNVVRKMGTFEYSPLRTPLTHMDLYRRSQGIPSTVSTPESVTIKKEAMEEDGKSPASNTGAGERVLNLKIAGADLKDSLDVAPATSTPPKKKSKVVTTSGAHPGGQKGGRVSEKKRMSTALLEKTIESCKQSIRDSIQNSDSSSEESDTSSDESNDELISSNKSTPSTKGEDKANGAIPGTATTTTVKPAGKGGNDSDVSDSELVIDIPDEEEAKKKQAEKEQKALSKLRKKSDADRAAKPRSILLNKDPPVVGKTDSRTNISIGSIKRKLGDDGSPLPGGGSGKMRKMEGMAKPSDSAKIPLKEKKKLAPDVTKPTGDKARKFSDALNKTRKDVSGTTLPKKNTEGVVKKKALLNDPPEKDTLKSAAKILAQKVMSRKHVHTTDKKALPAEKSKASNPDLERKLSSFTIPKHKPTALATEQVRMTPTNPRNVTPSVTSQHASGGSGFSRHKTFPLQKLEKYNEKVMMGVREVLVEMYEDMMTVFESQSSSKDHQEPKDADVGQQVAQLRLELERLKWMHQQEIAELQHNHDLTIAEIRQSLENERSHLLEEARRKADESKLEAVKEAKQKQWCANCGKEAIFYCCWNTSYCDYPCQQLHWPSHMATCSQSKDTNGMPAAPPASTEEQEEIQEEVKSALPEPPTPASPMETKEEVKAPIVPIIPVAEVVPPPVLDDVDDEDESDNEMMVIDESLHKEEEKYDADSDKPTQEEKAKAKEDLLSPESPAFDSKPKTIFTKSPEKKQEEEEEMDIETIADSTIKSVSETTVAASSSIPSFASNPLPLPIKTSTSSNSGVTAPAGTTVVSSKLLDDIFSKVLKKESTSSEPKEQKGDSNPIENKPQDEFKPDPTTEVEPGIAKASHSGGSAISAIGDRLLKARQNVTTSASSPVHEGDKAPPDTDNRGDIQTDKPKDTVDEIGDDIPPPEKQVKSPGVIDKGEEDDEETKEPPDIPDAAPPEEDNIPSSPQPPQLEGGDGKEQEAVAMDTREDSPEPASSEETPAPPSEATDPPSVGEGKSSEEGAKMDEEEPESTTQPPKDNTEPPGKDSESIAPAVLPKSPLNPAKDDGNDSNLPKPKENSPQRSDSPLITPSEPKADPPSVSAPVFKDNYLSCLTQPPKDDVTKNKDDVTKKDEPDPKP